MTINEEDTPKTMETDDKTNGPSQDEEVPSIDEQCKIIKKYQSEPLKKGDVWYLIDSKWFKQWQNYVGYVDYFLVDKGKKTSFPGPIDNSHLFKENSDDLKDHMTEEVNYDLLPLAAWNDLLKWYGMVEGSLPIARIVQEHGRYVKDLKVEVYLTKLKLCRHPDVDDCVIKKFSKTATLEDVIQAMRTAFNISDSKDIRIWNKYMSNTYELLTDTDSTIQDAELFDGQVVVVEQKNDDGTWPRHTRSSSMSSGYGLSSSPMDSSASATGWSASSPTSTGFTSSYGLSYGTSYTSYNDDARRRTSSGSSSASRAGLCGLSNLAGSYKTELNPQNPLGMRGEIAKAYAELMQQMWSGHHSYISPRNFKVAVGRFAPQFSGYQQQDSHELLAFLLDGLHEDLNRVKKKPYIEIPDHGGRPDEELAQEAWSNHQLRNCSIIVDLFHGLFKSTVVCPTCSKISVTFDPFCYLSLPLPVNKERRLNVVFVALEPEKKPMNMTIIVPKAGTVYDLAHGVSKLTGADHKKMIVAEVYNHRFHKVFEPRDALSHITDKDDIYVYEIPVSTEDLQDSQLIVVPVYLRLKKPHSMNSYSYGSGSCFGTPMLLPIPRNGITYNDLYHTMLRSLRRVMKQPAEKEAESLSEDINGAEDDEEKIKDDGQYKETDKDEAEMDTDERVKEKKPSNKRFFTIKSVNSYGSTEIESFEDDDENELRITSKMYLALDWDPKMKKNYYDEDAAEETDDHQSVGQKLPIKKSIQLQDCLDLFLTKEKLGADDPWYCPTCKKHQQASKKFDLWALPSVLVIHLKRFSYNRFWRDKLDSLVEFPIRDLILTPYVSDKKHPPAVYDLIAVSNHYGGLGGGHYTAYAKNIYDGQWYYYDDSSVSSADESRIVSKAAYVLFYMRRKDPMHPFPPANELLSDDENSVFQSQDGGSDEGEFDMET